MVRGWTLADVPRRVGWRSVLAMIRHAGRDSAIRQVTQPIESAWDTQTYLAAGTVDLLRMLVWMKTKDAQKGRNRPEPLPRPGDKPKQERFGNADMSMDEVSAFLARKRATATCSVPNCTNPAGPDGPCLEHQ